MRRLNDAIDAASGYMARGRAQELCRNLAVGFSVIGDEASELERFAYVVAAIRHRVKHFELVVLNDAQAASAIVKAWDAAGSVAA